MLREKSANAKREGLWITDKKIRNEMTIFFVIPTQVGIQKMDSCLRRNDN